MAKMMMLAVFGLTLTACTVTQAREEALLPAMRSSWPAIEESIVRGAEGSEGGPIIEEGILLFQGELAKEGGPTVDLLPTWLVLKPYSEADIAARTQAGEIGVGVAASMIERLANFEESVTKMR